MIECDDSGVIVATEGGMINEREYMVCGWVKVLVCIKI